jgi:hypothetical protein
MQHNKVMVLIGLVGLGLLGYGAYRFINPAEATARVIMGSGATVHGGDIATPVTAAVRTMQRGGVVYLILDLTDAAGNPIRTVRLSNGRRPSPPKVKIFDRSGQGVYSCTLRYG